MSTCGIIQRWLSRCSGRSLTEQPRAVCLNRCSPDRMVAAHWPGHTAQVQGGRPMNPPPGHMVRCSTSLEDILPRNRAEAVK